MDSVLDKLNMGYLTETFENQKITPDLVSMLSSTDFRTLGISNTCDMVRLRNECVKYGPQKLTTERNQSGAPKFVVPRNALETLIESGFQISDIAKLLSISESTVYRRMRQYKISKREFTSISDNALDLVLTEIMNSYPSCGESLLKQMIHQKGIRIPRWRLRDSIHRLDGRGVLARRRNRLKRRVYNVCGANHLWHIDTNHKLIRWRFVIVGGIDGFSRMVTFLKCTDNNNSDTILECFKLGVHEYGIPYRVRSDKGLENVKVADFMIQSRGPTGMITGKSTHNQRIERLWRDVYEGVLSFFYNLFSFLEDEGVLDPLNIKHLAALHHVYIAEINRRLSFWAKAWAGHKLRTVKSSPIVLWTSSQVQAPVGINEHSVEEYGVEGVLDHGANENERPIFESLQNELSENARMVLHRAELGQDSSFGIENYIRCVDILQE